MDMRDLRQRATDVAEKALMSRGGGRPTWRTYAGTAAFIAMLSVVLVLFRSSLGIVSVAMIYLLCCLLTALRAGRGPAVLAAVTTFLLFNFFFLPPYGTFSISSTDHVLALAVFFIVALVTSNLVANAQARARVAEQHEARANLLFRLNEGLVSGRSLAEVLNTIVQHVVQVYGATGAAILTQEGEGSLIVLASVPPDSHRQLTRNEQSVARLAMSSGQAAGLGTSRVRVMEPHGVGAMPHAGIRSGEDVLYLPIDTPSRQFGVLEVRGRPNGGKFDDDDRDLLGSLADQAALALDRVRLSDEAARTEVLARTNELQSALMAAVSHDLRTPLAAIKTSVTSLLDNSVSWDDEARAAFLEAIDEETDRLTMMVRNLLDLSRIEGGALHPDRDWNDTAELLHAVARRFTSRAQASGHTIQLQDELADVAFFDYVEIEQVLSNLIENALKYTPSGTAIRLSAEVLPGCARFSVADDGPGISPADRERIFDKFYRSRSNARVPGTGIGLAIARGLVEAHDGRIWLESETGGARFVFELPQPLAEVREDMP
ncbi:MAG: ATP-binding protein [Thermomicrobiales bacterium]